MDLRLQLLFSALSGCCIDSFFFCLRLAGVPGCEGDKAHTMMIIYDGGTGPWRLLFLSSTRL